MEAVQGYFEIAPRKFAKKKFKLSALDESQLLLAPKLTGICGSDVAWFLGDEKPEKLRRNLPMALLHEGIAVVKKVPKGSHFRPGDAVIVHPLIPGKKAPFLSENYFPVSKFMASNADGLAREFFVYPAKRVVPKPPRLPDEFAVLTEPLSIACRTVKEGRLDSRDRVAVIGDGMMGQFIALMLAHFAKIKKESLLLIGIDPRKLACAEKIATCINSRKVSDLKVLQKISGSLDAVFEAVGGKAQAQTLSQALEIVRPKGKIIVLGIEDNLVPVNIHKLVKKGIAMIGSSRSTIGDFRATLKTLARKPVQSHLEQFIHEKRFLIKSAKDLEKAFLYFVKKRPSSKVLISFDWSKNAQTPPKLKNREGMSRI